MYYTPFSLNCDLFSGFQHLTPSATNPINFGLCFGLYPTFFLRSRRRLFPRVSGTRVPFSLPLSPFHVISSSRHTISLFSTPALSVLLGKSSLLSSPRRPDAPRSGSAYHLYGDAGVSFAAFPVPAIESLSPVLRVAFYFTAAEARHLPLSTAAPITGDPSAPHTPARPDPCAAMTRPSNVRDSCTTVVCDECRRLKIRSDVESMSQAAAGEPSHLAP